MGTVEEHQAKGREKLGGYRFQLLQPLPHFVRCGFIVSARVVVIHRAFVRVVIQPIKIKRGAACFAVFGNTNAGELAPFCGYCPRVEVLAGVACFVCFIFHFLNISPHS